MAGCCLVQNEHFTFVSDLCSISVGHGCYQLCHPVHSFCAW